MAYTPGTWVENVTVIHAADLARIEAGIAAAGGGATVGTTAGTVAAGDDSRISGAAQKAANLSDLASPVAARTSLGLGTAATTASTDYDPAGAAAVLGSWGPRVIGTGDSKMSQDCDAVNNIFANSWLTHFSLASNGQVDLPINRAHGGYTSTQLEALLNTEVLGSNPDVVIEDMGSNDLLDGSNYPTVTLTSLTSIRTKLRAAGKPLVMTTLMPLGTGTPPLATPAAPTCVSAATGGTLPAASHQYRVCSLILAYSAGGNGTGVGGTTLASAATTVTTTGATSIVSIYPPYDPASRAGYNFYRSDDGGATWFLIGTTSGAHRVFLDTGAITSGVTVPAANTTAVAGDTTKLLKCLTVNAMKKRFAAAYDIPLVDVFSFCTDPATGLWKAGYSSDGTHPTPKASKLVGNYVWSQVSQFFRSRPAMGSRLNAGDVLNLFRTTAAAGVNYAANIPNGMLLLPAYAGDNTTVRTWSQGFSGGFGSTAAGASSALGARTGHNGNAYALTRTLPEPRFDSKTKELVTIVPGHVYAVKAVLELSDQGGADLTGAGINFQLLWSPAQTPANLLNLKLQSDFGPAVVTFTDTAPAGATGITVSQFNIDGGEGTVAVSEVFLYDLTASNLVSV